VVGRENLDGMRLKGDGRRPGSLRPGDLHHAAQQRLVRQVDSVEVANRHHTGRQRFTEFLKVADNAHTGKRNWKFETGNRKIKTCR